MFETVGTGKVHRNVRDDTGPYLLRYPLDPDLERLERRPYSNLFRRRSSPAALSPPTLRLPLPNGLRNRFATSSHLNIVTSNVRHERRRTRTGERDYWRPISVVCAPLTEQ
jgi:hypothetical protein